MNLITANGDGSNDMLYIFLFWHGSFLSVYLRAWYNFLLYQYVQERRW